MFVFFLISKLVVIMHGGPKMMHCGTTMFKVPG
jgi:hypothetical protein